MSKHGESNSSGELTKYVETNVISMYAKIQLQPLMVSEKT